MKQALLFIYLFFVFFLNIITAKWYIAKVMYFSKIQHSNMFFCLFVLYIRSGTENASTWAHIHMSSLSFCLCSV